MRLTRGVPRTGGMILAIVLFLLTTCQLGAQNLEYDVKAAMIYNFAKFVRWPQQEPNQARALVVGVVGEGPMRDALDQVLKGKEVEGRQIRTVRFARTEPISSCEILFVGSSESTRVREILDHLQGRPVLTVGETDGFSKTGGVIGFVMEGNKVRFEINVAAARRVGIEISSKLLRLATVVGNGGT